jgi:hypothetical protein
MLVLLRALALPTALIVLVVLTACPANPPALADQAPVKAEPLPDDPRVVQVGEDLYRKKTSPVRDPAAANRGSGVPDETNGECRLFAPGYPNPECCPKETGFDAEAAQRICGHELYLGESIRRSCGYFFMHASAGGTPLFFRVSTLLATDPKQARDEHLSQIRRTYRDSTIEQVAIKGVDDGYRSSANGLNWAHLPGWTQVRLVSWEDDACELEAVDELLAIIAHSPEPPAGSPRIGILPRARDESN